MLNSAARRVADLWRSHGERMKMAGAIASLCLAIGLGCKIAWVMSDAGQCVARQETRNLRGAYQEVPERAHDAAVLWCRKQARTSGEA